MPGVRRVFTSRWAQGGAVTDPGQIKTELGWVAEKPPYQYFNWWQKRVDDMLAHLEENGIAIWHASTAYLQGALTIGSDGLVYQAVIANTGNDPTVDGGTNWVEYRPYATTSVPGIIEIASSLEVLGKSDNTKAVTPGSLAFLNASDALAGLVELATAAEGQALVDPTRAITPAVLSAIAASTSARGITRLATAAEALAGTATDRAVTPQSIGTANQSLGAAGYKMFPGGLILQWGSNAITPQQVTFDVVLPIAFPNAHAVALSSAALGGTGETGPSHGAEPHPSTPLTHVRLSTGFNGRTVYWACLGY